MNLINEIIKKIPNNLTDLEKARFIYIELGKILEFDTTTMRNCNESYFKKKINQQIDVMDLSSNMVNCHNWCDIYIKLLNYVGVKADKCKIGLIGHAWVLIYIDESVIYADATTGDNDLARIKSHLTTNNFYLIYNDNDDDIIDNPFDQEFYNTLREIDKNLGYEEERLNEKEKIEELRYNANQFDNLFDKVNFIFKNINLEKLGFFEGNFYINHVLNYCLDTFEMAHIKAVTLSKNLDDGEVDSIKCIMLENNDNSYYYIFSKLKGIYQIEKEKINKLFQMGYSIENHKTSLDLKNYKFFKRNSLNKLSQLRLKKEALYTKMYNNDDDLNFDTDKKRRI